MFPFSAYFFLIFLPWLPAIPFAMIVIGSGFLIMAPLVLGFAHGYRIVDGYREEIRDGVWWKPAIAGLIAVSVLPTVIGWNMWQDRRTLTEAIDYVYSPDYRKDITYPGNLGRLENSLQHLRDMKHGIFLPFLSPLYNSIVFHDLVLPDAKIENLQQTFFGGGPTPQVNAMLRTTSSWSEGNFPATQTIPSKDVALADVQVADHAEGAVTVSRLTLTMQNHGATQSEYVAAIHLPENVYVSDFVLTINHERVPARIVEKKTAMWVYEKISVLERRDPGLLIYKNRTELELRVYPFASGESRQVEIELIHPNVAPTTISIGNRNVELSPGALPEKAVITSCTTEAGSVAVADGANLAAMGVHRQPYLHVLIDCSQGWSFSTESLAESLRKARDAFPEVKLARVTAINYEARDVVPELVPVDQLDAAAIAKNLLPFRGGLLEDRFLKRGLLHAYDRMQKGPDDALLRPQFVLITGHGQPAIRDGGLEPFLRLAPDARIIYAQQLPGFQAEDMVTHQAAPNAPPIDVLLWRWADHYAVSTVGTNAVATFLDHGPLPGAPLLYQAGQFAPAASTAAADATSRFADGVRTWAAQETASLNPSTIQNGAAALLGLSKKTRILVTDSSFIAVESSAQWRILEEKEKAKLKQNQVFELEEKPAVAPEPSTWALFLASLALLAWKKRRQAKAAQT